MNAAGPPAPFIIRCASARCFSNAVRALSTIISFSSSERRCHSNGIFAEEVTCLFVSTQSTWKSWPRMIAIVPSLRSAQSSVVGIGFTFVCTLMRPSFPCETLMSIFGILNIPSVSSFRVAGSTRTTGAESGCCGITKLPNVGRAFAAGAGPRATPR